MADSNSSETASGGDEADAATVAVANRSFEGTRLAGAESLWRGLEADWQSVLVGVGLAAVVLGFDVPIPGP